MPPKKRVKAEAQLEADVVATQPEPQHEPQAEAPTLDVVPAEPNVVRSSKFYFMTGDIALSAWDTEGKEKPAFIFRVDRAFLARNSSVLAEKFQMVTARGNPRKIYDGVPLIALEDWQEDVEDLLSFMYNPAALLAVLTERQSDPAGRMSSLLATACKYKVEGVKPFVLHLLEKRWPPTLVDWLRLQGELSQLHDLWSSGCIDVRSTSLDSLFPVDPAATITMGVIYDMPSILPAAFYSLSAIDLRDDWDRWNASQPWSYSESEDMKTTNPSKCWRRTARWSWLAKGTLVKLLLGKQALQARRAVLWRVYQVGTPAEVTNGKQHCQNELERLMNDYGATFAGSGPTEPLQALTRMLTAMRSNKTLCNACRAAVRANINRELKKLWADLPGMFSLGDGEEEEAAEGQ